MIWYLSVIVELKKEWECEYNTLRLFLNNASCRLVMFLTQTFIIIIIIILEKIRRLVGCEPYINNITCSIDYYYVPATRRIEISFFSSSLFPLFSFIFLKTRPPAPPRCLDATHPPLPLSRARKRQEQSWHGPVKAWTALLAPTIPAGCMP